MNEYVERPPKPKKVYAWQFPCDIVPKTSAFPSAPKGSWLVIVDGEITFMTNEEFNKKYESEEFEEESGNCSPKPNDCVRCIGKWVEIKSPLWTDWPSPTYTGWPYPPDFGPHKKIIY